MGVGAAVDWVAGCMVLLSLVCEAARGTLPPYRVICSMAGLAGCFASLSALPSSLHLVDALNQALRAFVMVFPDLLSEGRFQDFVWRGGGARQPLVFGFPFVQLRYANDLAL